MNKYFILSGEAGTGKTTCILDLFHFLQRKNYKEVVPTLFLNNNNNDIIAFLHKENQYVLINSASDNTNERIVLDNFITSHSIFSEKDYSNLVIITALREWATGPYNCNIRIEYERTLHLDPRDQAVLADIIVGKVDTNGQFDIDTRTRYCLGICTSSRAILINPPFNL